MDSVLTNIMIRKIKKKEGKNLIKSNNKFIHVMIAFMSYGIGIYQLIQTIFYYSWSMAHI